MLDLKCPDRSAVPGFSGPRKRQGNLSAVDSISFQGQANHRLSKANQRERAGCFRPSLFYSRIILISDNLHILAAFPIAVQVAPLMCNECGNAGGS
jgi:hypothetical protein